MSKTQVKNRPNFYSFFFKLTMDHNKFSLIKHLSLMQTKKPLHLNDFMCKETFLNFKIAE